MTLQERCDAYAKAYPKWSGSWPRVIKQVGSRDGFLATWVIGNDYRNKTKFYGAYPRGYLERVHAMWPDVKLRDVLHVFSGSLPEGDYVRCDSMQDAELRGSVYDIRSLVDRRYGEEQKFELILADPPYTAADAERYGTGMVNRGKAIRALAEVAAPGAHMVWLDTVWPMHSKKLWVTVGRIAVVRSTNHRVRMATVFERVGATA